MVYQGGVGGAPVDGPDPDVGVGELLQERLALSLVALQHGNVDVRGERVSWVAGFGCGDDLLVGRCRSL